MRFELAGTTALHPAASRLLRRCSIYTLRRLAVDYLSFDERAELNILTIDGAQPTLPGVEESVTETVQGQDIPAHPPSD